MTRPIRLSRPGLIHHVLNRGNKKEPVFLEENDYYRFLDILYRFKKKYQFKLFAYCLMTNHIHLLIQTSDKGSISKIMQSITLAHTKHYHHKYKTCGHIWQGRFKSPIVSDDEYLLTAMNYIEKNPIKAKIAKDLNEYTWSSYHLNTRGEKSKLIDREENPAFVRLGDTWTDRVKNYKKIIGTELDEDLFNKIQDSLTGSRHFMSKVFEHKLESLLPKRRLPGRPKKQFPHN